MCLLLISNTLSILTNGFSVWDRFYHKPYFILKIEPLIIPYEDAYTMFNKSVGLILEIESSGGIYVLGDEYTVDKLNIIEDFYFKEEVRNDVKFGGVTLNKKLLDSNSPNINPHCSYHGEKFCK